MFQFTSFAPRRAYVFNSPVIRQYDPRRVSPFGNPRIYACVQLPGAYRSLTTSFIAF